MKVNIKYRIILILGVVEQLSIVVVSLVSEPKYQWSLYSFTATRQIRDTRALESHYFPMEWHWVWMGTVTIVGLPHCWGAQIRLSPLYRRVGPGHRVGEGLGVKRYWVKIKCLSQGPPVRRPLMEVAELKIQIFTYTWLAREVMRGGLSPSVKLSPENCSNSDVVKTVSPIWGKALQLPVVGPERAHVGFGLRAELFRSLLCARHCGVQLPSKHMSLGYYWPHIIRR